MQVQIIYDNTVEDRFPHIARQLAEQNISDWRFWKPAEDRNSVIRSINLSHKQVIRWAKDEGLPEVAIFEDDVLFTAPGAWQRFLDNTPPFPFDIYLGGAYGLNRPITGLTDKINGFHCYICRERFYETFLGVPDDVHIDTAMDGKGVFYVEYPFIALQRAGWSANTRAFSDKNADLSKEDIYHG